MHTRRSLSWMMLSAVAIVGLLLGACGGAQPTPTPVAEPLVIAFGFNGPTSDLGWTWVANEARLAVEQAYGDRVRTVYTENVPYSQDGSRIFEQFVADGADMVIENTGYGEVFQTVIAEHPDVAFMGMNQPMYPNEIGYYVDVRFTAYLIGMAAGLMTETNKIGYVCSFAGMNADVNAYAMGAQSVNPDVTVQVACINSWFDPAAARQAAEALVDDGADFLYGIMDEPAFLVVAEERGVWAATWNTDCRQFGPTAYVTSHMINWSEFYVQQVGKLLDGTWAGGELILLPLGHGTDIDRWGDSVPQEVRDQVDAMRTRMIDEGYNPFVGPIYDTQGTLRFAEGEVMTPEYGYDQWTWAVQGVVGLD